MCSRLTKLDFSTYRDCWLSILVRQIVKRLNIISNPMYKAESQGREIENRLILSVCDVMRDNTNEIIMKIESLLPTYIGNFADLQSEYLRIARDFFGTCYIAENELLERMGVDQKAIEGFDKYLKVLTRSMILEIDITSNFQKMFVDNTMSTMKTYDDYVKLMLSAFAKMLEYALTLTPKK